MPQSIRSIGPPISAFLHKSRSLRMTPEFLSEKERPFRLWEEEHWGGEEGRMARKGKRHSLGGLQGVPLFRVYCSEVEG